MTRPRSSLPISGQTLDVHIGEQARGLSETALSQLLSASADGKLSVDSTL